MNMRQAVVAQQPNGEAVVTLTLAAEQGRRLGGARAGRSGRHAGRGSGATASAASARCPTTGPPTSRARRPPGLAAFVEHEGDVFRLLGYTTEATSTATATISRARSRASTGSRIGASSASSRCACASERLERPMTIDRVAKTYDVPLAVEDLALLNNVDPGTELRAGDWVKIVDGEPPP